MLKQGLYEQLINRMIDAELKNAEDRGMYDFCSLLHFTVKYHRLSRWLD